MSIYLYKDSPFLANDRRETVSDAFTQSSIDLCAFNSYNNLPQLLFFAQMCVSHIKTGEKKGTCIKILDNCDSALIDQFLAYVSKILYDNISSQNILIAFKIISLLSKDKCFYSHLILLNITKLILSNLSLLNQQQINQINLNVLLKIIKYNYKQEERRNIILEHFPIGFIISCTSEFLNTSFHVFGLQWIKFLNTFCSYSHSIEDGRLIFENISNIRNKINMNLHLKYFCNIIVNMIKFKTLPLDLFVSNNYNIFFRNLILKKGNSGIIEHALYVIGLCTMNNIIYGFFYTNFFIRIFFAYPFNEKIRILVLWNLSVGLNSEISHFLIETNFLNEIISIYQNSSLKLKHQIISLITDMMCTSSDPPEIFLANNIIEILIDAMLIFNDDISKIALSLYQTIEDCIAQNQNSIIENLKQFLLDSNFMEIIEILENSEDQFNLQLSVKLCNFLYTSESNPE